MTERNDAVDATGTADGRRAGETTAARDWLGRDVVGRRRWLLWGMIAALLLVLVGEEALSDRRLSMTVDEGAHLYAGVQHWRSRDFGVNPEHPPLVKLVAAAPVLGMRMPEVHPPRMHFYAEEYGGAAQMLRGPEGARMLARARLAAGLFTLLLAMLVLLAGWEMFGPVTGVLALFLFVWEPTVLAHGALVTTDMGMACFCFAAVYAWWRWVQRPSVGRVAVCGLAAGLAMASKVSGTLVLPILLACAAAELWRWWREGGVAMGRVAGRLAGALGAVAVMGYVVLWGFYAFRYAARPAGLAIAPTLAQFSRQLPHAWEMALLGWVARWHLLPEAYLYGWVKVVVDGTGHPAFLLGRVYPAGTALYFPVVLLLKSSLPLLLLLAAGVALVVARQARGLRLAVLFPVLGLLVLLLAGMSTRLDIGVRHELAMYPFAVLLAGASAAALLRRGRGWSYAVAAVMVWLVVSSVRAFPDYLPYSNELDGGSARTYRVLSDSNVDWGQQLKEVDAYLAAHPTGECWFLYSDMGGPGDHARGCRPLPTGLALIAGIPQAPVPPRIAGTVLVGAMDASGVLWGGGSLNPYRQFQEGRPAAMVGNSVLVYHGEFAVPGVAAAARMSVVPMMLRTGQAEQALGVMEEAAALDPGDPLVEARMGGVLLAAGHAAEAQAAFARAMADARALGPEEARGTAGMIAELTQPRF